MNKNSLIEVHVISPNNKTILDLDCSVGIDTTLSELFEIIFSNYHMKREKISALYALVPFRNKPLELHTQDYLKTLKELDFSNGVTFRIIYVGENK